ncbi:MAG TPA: response regulator transcription factor [Cyclobacteriaceae bacterium]|jgi:DNA-binding NarL/FixJ family response regulator|nr:response regulator transcription factor [Cyclobacteriaceae bacterium]
METVKLLLVDDQALFRESIRMLLQQNTQFYMFEAANGLEALEILKLNHIDVVLLDVNMPEMNGIEVSSEILENYRDTNVIILSQHGGEALIIHLLRQGVHGFLHKNTSARELKMAIETVMRGEKYIQETISNIFQENFNMIKNAPTVVFNKREAEILLQLKMGKSSKEIAFNMDLKENTVNSYREVMLRKTKTKNVAELITYAHQNGILG